MFQDLSVVTSSLRNQRKEGKMRKNGKGTKLEARGVLGEEEGGAHPRGMNASHPRGLNAS